MRHRNPEHTEWDPISAFIAYSHEDRRYLGKLHQHLSLLRNEGKLDDWHDRRIDPGQDWEQAIDARLYNDRLILLLVSPGFMASKYCWEKEMTVAMQRHEAGEAIVIPIIVRDCDWESAPFGKLEALPEKGKAITRWSPQDSGWRNVAKGIRTIVDFLRLEGANSTLSELPAAPTDPHAEDTGRRIEEQLARIALAGELAPKTTVKATATSQMATVPKHDMIADLKRYLSHPAQPILLNDLVMLEVERVRDAIASDPSYAPGPHLTGGEIAEQLPRYEELSETLMTLFATGCRWAAPGDHQPWVNALERLSSLPVPDGRHIQPGFKINLYRYPALLSLYSGGVTAVAVQRYDILAALLTKGSVLDYYDNKVPTVLAVNSWGVLENDVAKTVPSWDGRWLPFNQYLCSNPRLREALREILPEEHQYEAALDRFEYLLGLVFWDLFSTTFKSGWAPASCFAWRDRNRDWDPKRMPVLKQLVEEIQHDGAKWPPLNAGLFNGSLERLISTMQAYNQSLLTRVH